MSRTVTLNIISVFCKSCTIPNTKCHLKKKCKFAHTIDEITPVVCKYGDGCVWRELTCIKIHDGETKNEYASRVGFKTKGGSKHTIHTDSVVHTRMIVKKLSSFLPIDSDTNVGAMIMKKWGWEVGKGLGPNLQGILVPVLPVAPSRSMVNEKQRVKGPHVHIKFVKASMTLEESINQLTI